MLLRRKKEDILVKWLWKASASWKPTQSRLLVWMPCWRLSYVHCEFEESLVIATCVSPGDLTSFSWNTFRKKPNWYPYCSGVQNQTMTFFKAISLFWPGKCLQTIGRNFILVLTAGSLSLYPLVLQNTANLFSQVFLYSHLTKLVLSSLHLSGYSLLWSFIIWGKTDEIQYSKYGIITSLI